LSPASLNSAYSPSFDLDSDDNLEHDSLLDPFELESDEDDSSNDEDLLQNTRGNAGPGRSKVLLRATRPLNSSQPTLDGGIERITPGSEKQAVETPKAPGHQYDVDSFTRLLLTGDASFRRRVPAEETYSKNSTANTSESPLQADLGPLTNDRQYTSRSPQDSKEPSCNHERSRLKSKSTNRTENVRPTTPQRYHGKPTERTFQDIMIPRDLSLVSSGFIIGPVESNSRSTPTSPQAPANLNKPLPLPPRASGSPMLPPTDIDLSVSSSMQEKRLPDPANQVDPQPQVPPVSRYSSYSPIVVTPEPSNLGWRNKTFRLETNPVDPPPSSSKLPPPPPPPPRRHGRARGFSTSSTSSAISGASASLTPSSTDEYVSRPFRQQPAIPPTRTPSNSSLTRPTRKIHYPNPPTTIAPPVPPPRRESSRSSYSRAGKSSDYPPPGIGRHNTDPWASWKSPSPSAKGTLGQESSEADVLAGLSELQREVDELRGKFRD
jgi:hypothetical protein